MSHNNSYSFNAKQDESTDPAVNGAVADILMECFPGAKNVARAAGVNDRMGVDWWVEMSGRHIGIDIKVRGEDYKEKTNEDDLALEVWSVVERKKLGWTRDATKRCDYVLWYWRDTGRFHLVPFQSLCAVFRESLDQWTEEYRSARQHTPEGDYHSECVYVPRKIVWRAMYEQAHGYHKTDGCSREDT